MTPDLLSYSRPVLDRGFVELFLPVNGSDRSIATAARVSRLSDSGGDDEKDKRLIRYLIRNREWSPFQLATITFRVKLPGVVLDQWVRHRSESFNVQSYRHSEAEPDEFYIPSEWRIQSPTDKQGSDGVITDEITIKGLYRSYKESIRLSYLGYQAALDAGVAREQARLFLLAKPLYSTMVVGACVRDWAVFLSQRQSEHAQWEIRQYANAVHEFMTQYFPWTMEALKEFPL